MTKEAQKPFLEDAPDGFEPTMELKWFVAPTYPQDAAIATFKMNHPSAEFYPDDPFYVLCQKWQIVEFDITENSEVSSLLEVWVRVPCSQ